MRIVSVWGLIGIGIIVAVLLVALFPKRALIEQVRTQEGNDELTASYLASLLRTEPRNHELRLLLAEKKFALGRATEAVELLEPLELETDPALRERARLLRWRMLVEQAARLDRLDPAQAGRRDALSAQLAELAAGPWKPARLRGLLADARALGEHVIARALVQRLLVPGSGADPRWIAEEARIALGEGHYREAARLAMLARERSTDPDERRALFREAVAALQSGDMTREALDLAEANLGELAADEDILLFLTRLALAAGQPARAQPYMRRLLRLSETAPAAAPAGTPSASVSWLERLLSALVAPAHAAEAAVATNAAEGGAPAPKPPAGTPPLRPYDETLYNLAWDVFLANGNQNDAWRVAAGAVAQRPEDLRWRERLAQVSEWTGRPAEALAQWNWIAQKTGSDAAWQAILRLAPGLFEFKPLLAAWRHVSTRRALTREELDRVIDMVEDSGAVEDGISFLEDYYARHRDPAALELAADLEERSGRLDLALATAERVITDAGTSVPRAMRLAALRLTRTDLPGALAALRQARPLAGPADEDYFRLLGELAWSQQDDDTATDAYRMLAGRPRPERDDIARLVQLLRPAHPAEAAMIAESGWRARGDPELLLLALEIRNERADRLGLRRLFAAIDAQAEARLAKNRQFLALRAGFRQLEGDRAGAAADWRRAIAAEPRDAELRLALLWLLVDARADPRFDARFRPELRRELRGAERDFRGNPDFHDVFAAGWLALGEARTALNWFRRQAQAKSDDYLWLMGYADALEAAGDEAMALRVRRHAWSVVRNRTAPKIVAADRQRLYAWVRLATQFAPGDPAFAAIRHVLRQDPAAPQGAAQHMPSPAAQDSRSPAAQDSRSPAAQDSRSPAAMDATARELILAWAISTESFEAARAWRWIAYGRRLAAPAWAEVSLALERRDLDALEQLLAARADDIPRYNRIDAARETRRIRLAQTLGFEAQERHPHDDEVHLRLATDLLASASSVSLRDAVTRRGVLRSHERGANLQVWVTPRLRLSAELSDFRQSADARQLAGVPGNDRSLAFALLARHDRGQTELRLGRRSGLSDFSTLTLTHTRPLHESITATLGLSLRERAGDTVALYVGGHKNEASLAWNYAFSRREYLSGRIWEARYHTQQDSFVGSGRGATVEIGHRFRTEYPDWTLRLARSAANYERAQGSDARSAELNPAGIVPGGDFFLPQGSRTWALSAGFGTEYRERYGRGLRPFAEFGRSVNTVTGNGYNWLMGAGMSVLGPDYLSLAMLRSSGGAGTNLAIREMGLRYQYFFDRF